MSKLQDDEQRMHRANTVRRALEGLGAGTATGGLTAAALRAAGVKASPALLAAGGAAAGGLTGAARGHAENLKDSLGQKRQDDRHLRRLVLRESMRKHSHSAFVEELVELLGSRDGE